jgi:hypothetical protein
VGGFLLVPSLLPALLPVLVLILVACLLAGCDHEVDIAPPKASHTDPGDRAQEAQQALDDFVESVRNGSRQDAVAVATSRSSQLLGWVHDNAEALRISDLSIRYVDEGTPLTAEQQAAAGPSAWRGDVQLTYRYGGVDRSPARLESSVVFVPTSRATRIASFGGPDDRSPLWLTDRLSVVRTARSLVVVAGGPAGRYPGLVSRALRQVARVLPGWHGPLLVEVPRSRVELDSVLQAQPGQYDNIAAVTTTADGSLATGAPVRVFINPSVFERLKQRGAQVVMSHEATHVATGATFVSMPTWLLEGFADFVALDGTGIPVSVAAGQILPRIKKSGLPKGLPTSAELEPTANGLGATYEEAWLACRFLAQEFGTDRLVRFYRAVSNGASASSSFRRELGTTQAAFVTRWRADLARLAGVTR